MSAPQLSFEVLAGQYLLARADADARLPEAPLGATFFVALRNAKSCTVVCEADAASPQLGAEFVVDETRWSVLRLEGDFAFDVSGVMAAFAVPLGEAGVPALVYAAFETDFILVAAENLDRACRALESAGHVVRGDAR